jgi:hypothetical protein
MLPAGLPPFFLGLSQFFTCTRVVQAGSPFFLPFFMRAFFTTLRLGAMTRCASAAAISLLTLGSASAQVYYPAVNGDSNGSYTYTVTGAANTGCEVAYYGTGNTLLKAFVWDDANGSYLGWDKAGTKGAVPLLGVGAQDPDVVVDPGTTSGGTGKILVTYVINGNIFFEVRQLNGAGSAFTTIKASTQVNTAGSGTCANPNVDVDNDGEALIVWEQGGIIYARSFDLTNSTSATTLRAVYRVSANQPGFTFSQPDVSINRNTNNGSASTLIVPSFVFVATNTATLAQSIRLYQPAIASVRSGSSPGANTVIYTGSASLETPRISATHNYSAFGSYGYEVVLTDIDPAGNKIVGLNNSSASSAVSSTNLPTVTVLNNAGNGISPLYALAACERPVVTYAGDAILVAWTLLDGGSVPPTRNGDKEVLQVRLNYINGAVQNYNQNNGDGYAIVNKSEVGDQYLPSVAGRLTSFTRGIYSNNDALYAFFDENASQILHKSSAYQNVNLRPAAGNSAPATAGTSNAAIKAGAFGTSRLEAYPNPFHGTAALNLGLREGEQVRSLSVYNTTGQLVSTLEPAQAGPTIIDAAAAGLKPGLYVLRLTTTLGAQSLRLSYE